MVCSSAVRRFLRMSSRCMALFASAAPVLHPTKYVIENTKRYDHITLHLTFVTMKLPLALAFLVASATVSSVISFSVPPTAFAPSKTAARQSVVLDASRRRAKIASVTKWLELRGQADGTDVAEEKVGLMTNDEGLEYVKLVHPETGASSEVYLLGGVVTSYKDGEGQEYIAVRPDAMMDGSKPISGGLSHCWPQVTNLFSK